MVRQAHHSIYPERSRGMELAIKTERVLDGVTTVLLEGIIDAHTYEKLEETFNRLIEQENYKLIIDLSNVDYLSSAGAGVFISVYSIIQENDGDFVLVNPGPKVKEVFDLLGLTQLFTISRDLNSALNKFT